MWLNEALVLLGVGKWNGWHQLSDTLQWWKDRGAVLSTCFVPGLSYSCQEESASRFPRISPHFFCPVLVRRQVKRGWKRPSRWVSPKRLNEMKEARLILVSSATLQDTVIPFFCGSWCLSFCKATWWHMCCLISTQLQGMKCQEHLGGGCWLWGAGEGSALINKNAHFQTFTQNQAIISTCQQKRKKCFKTSFQESEKKAEQQQEIDHLIVSRRLSAPQLGIFPNLPSRMKFPPPGAALLSFNVYSLLKEKNVATTKFAADFWQAQLGSHGLKTCWINLGWTNIDSKTYL